MGNRLKQACVPDPFVSAGEHMPLVPRLLQVAAMIDRNPIKPRTPRSLSPELIHLTEGFEKNIVGGILSLMRVAQKSQREVINGAAMLLVDSCEFRDRPARLPLVAGSACCRRFAHACVHRGLDRRQEKLSRTRVLTAGFRSRNFSVPKKNQPHSTPNSFPIGLAGAASCTLPPSRGRYSSPSLHADGEREA